MPNIFDELTPAERHAALRRGSRRLYSTYLRSDAWRELRARVIRRAGAACEQCGRGFLTPLDVHHRTYRRIGAEQEADLLALCRACHAQADKRRRAA